MRTFIIVALATAVLVACCEAGDREERREQRRSEPNWIIERQTTYQVQGVPTSRLIIGKREFDKYPNGEVFEKGVRVR